MAEHLKFDCHLSQKNLNAAAPMVPEIKPNTLYDAVAEEYHGGQPHDVLTIPNTVYVELFPSILET